MRVPDVDIEAVRDLVRAHEDARADLMRGRHRSSKLLLRRDRIYSGGHLDGIHELRQRLLTGRHYPSLPGAGPTQCRPARWLRTRDKII